MPARSNHSLRLTAAAAAGRFELQQCSRCAAVQYPPREACHRCLSVDLKWTRQSGSGRLLTETTLHHSHLPQFRRDLPWRIGLVQLSAGPILVAHVHRSVPAAPSSVDVTVRLDEAGYAVLVARTREEDDMNDDARFRKMACDPRGLNVFVTVANSDIGKAMVQELTEAGAARVWSGESQSCDLRDADSIKRAAGAIGTEVDVLINTARHEGSGRDEMELNYFGLLRLSEQFLPAMQVRAAARKQAGGAAAAWVNLLSLSALCNMPSQPTFSASMAAALSASQNLRLRARPAGIRVMNVLPGPQSAQSLARSIVAGLRTGVEDLFAGDVAQEWLSRWLESPKVLEREVAG